MGHTWQSMWRRQALTGACERQVARGFLIAQTRVPDRSAAAFWRNVAIPRHADVQKSHDKSAVPSIWRNRNGCVLFDVLSVDLPMGSAVGGPRERYQPYRNGGRSGIRLGYRGACWPLSREADRAGRSPA